MPKQIKKDEYGKTQTSFDQQGGSFSETQVERLETKIKVLEKKIDNAELNFEKRITKGM